MSFSAKDVQALRKATGAGMMDAKRALEETEGDMDRAADRLAADHVDLFRSRVHRYINRSRAGEVAIADP